MTQKVKESLSPAADHIKVGAADGCCRWVLLVGAAGGCCRWAATRRCAVYSTGCVKLGSQCWHVVGRRQEVVLMYWTRTAAD